MHVQAWLSGWQQHAWRCKRYVKRMHSQMTVVWKVSSAARMASVKTWTQPAQMASVSR